MRRMVVHKILGMLLVAAASVIMCKAQSPYFSIFDMFEKAPAKGEGRVIIHQPASLKSLVGTKIDSNETESVNGKTYLITKGYRIQIYSGNNQRKSKEEAMAMEEQLKKLYPDIQTYIRLNAPFWKLHAGNYRSFEEAWQMLRTLRQDFPKIKNEIYIVEDEIRLPLD